MMPAPLAIVRGLGRSYPFLKMPTRHGATGRWVFLVFRTGEREPSWVVKGTREPRGIPALRGERDAICRLEEAVARSPISSQVPRLLGYEETASEACLVENFLSGVPLSGRTACSWDGANALEWLVRFREAVPARPVRVGRPEIEAALRAVSDFLDDETARRRLEERLASLDGLVLPRGLIHGDFNPHNVYRDESQDVLHVIDWEESRENEFITDDVFHYEAVASFIGRAIDREKVRSVLARLGIPLEVEAPLRLHFLARAPSRDAIHDTGAPDRESVERWVQALRLALDLEPRGLQVG